MALLIVTVLLAVGGWALVTLTRRLKKQRVGFAVWSVFALFAIFGLAVGVRATMFFEYQPNPNYRISGIPVPVAFLHLEGGNWVDFPVPTIQAWITVVTNAVLIAVGTTLPLWLFTWPAGGRKRAGKPMA